jgi:hypothetical protein
MRRMILALMAAAALGGCYYEPAPPPYPYAYPYAYAPGYYAYPGYYYPGYYYGPPAYGGVYVRGRWH